MRIEFKMESTGLGYFTGLAKPIAVDTDQLSPEEAARVEQLVSEAGFFDLPAQPRRPAKGAADYRQYVVTVDDGKQRHTIRASDPSASPGLRALLDYLRSQVKK